MTRILDFLRVAVVVAGAFVAHRALAADPLELAAQASNAISNNPELVALASWATAEIVARLFPTRQRASTFFFLRDIFSLVGAAFLFAAKVSDTVGQSPIAQNVRAPKAPEVPKDTQP